MTGRSRHRDSPLSDRLGRSVRSLGASVGAAIASLVGAVAAPRAAASKDLAAASAPRASAASGPMAARYDALVEEMLAAHSVRVRRWRRGTTGVAWETRRGEARQRWIEAPYPKGPVSCAVFLHEIAHHAIGLGAISPRCLEEHAAWEWAIARMRERGIEPGISVERRMHAALRYAVAKAVRRGLRRVPPPLVAYLEPPRGRQR